MAETVSGHSAVGEDSATRRDFLTLTGVAVGLVGAASIGWAFIDYMNPSADTLALATKEVNLAPIAEGSAITVMWRGMPIFVRHRTPAEIESARDVDVDKLPDPQTDEERVQRPQWLIMVGICTHLGCIPKGQKPGDATGDYGGWFCPCHGSHYDTSGRIRKGPAPANMLVPAPITFTTDTTVMIG